MTNADATIARLAAGQNSFLTTAQLRDQGLSYGQVGRRRGTQVLVSSHRGVHRHAAAPAGWIGALHAAVLAGGGRSVASHRSAARLHGLEGFAGHRPEVTVPDLDVPIRRGVRYHRTNLLEALDVTSVSNVPVTGVPRTLLDLAGVLPYERFERTAQVAIIEKRVTEVALVAVLERVGRRGRRGTAGLRAFLRDAVPDDRLASVLEQRLLAVVQRAGLGTPVLQHELVCDDGRRVVLDAAYPDRRLAVEADGHRWHGTSEQLRADLARSRAIQASGWAHHRFGWADLHERAAATLLELRRLAHA